MKILQLSQFFPPVLGGEERHVHNLTRTLARRHEVVVATYGARDEDDEIDGIRVHRMRPISGRLPGIYQTDRQHAAPVPDPSIVRALHRVIEDVRPDVVHAHNWIVHSLLPLRRRTSAPFVLSLHDFSHVCSIKRYMYMDEELCPGPSPKRCIPCASRHYRGPVGVATYVGLSSSAVWKRRSLDKILAVSRAVAEGSRLSDFGVPWEVVPNFVSDDLGIGARLSRPAWVPTGPYWFFAGDLTADKGISVLLDAYASLPESRPALVLAGRSVMKLPEQLPSGVVLAGPRPHAEVLAAFAHADAATTPSTCPDACPTVVLEAMAQGVPVVATAIGGMVDMVQDGVDGRLVPPGNAHALAAALWELHQDPQRREVLGRVARQHVEGFRAHAVVERIERTYEQLVAERSR